MCIYPVQIIEHYLLIHIKKYFTSHQNSSTICLSKRMTEIEMQELDDFETVFIERDIKKEMESMRELKRKLINWLHPKAYLIINGGWDDCCFYNSSTDTYIGLFLDPQVKVKAFNDYFCSKCFSVGDNDIFKYIDQNNKRGL